MIEQFKRTFPGRKDYVPKLADTSFFITKEEETRLKNKNATKLHFASLDLPTTLQDQ